MFQNPLQNLVAKYLIFKVLQDRISVFQKQMILEQASSVSLLRRNPSRVKERSGLGPLGSGHQCSKAEKTTSKEQLIKFEGIADKSLPVARLVLHQADDAGGGYWIAAGNFVTFSHSRSLIQ